MKEKKTDEAKAFFPKVQKALDKAAKKGFSEERKNRYVYGTMRKTGWTPSTQKKRPKLHEVIKEKAKK